MRATPPKAKRSTKSATVIMIPRSTAFEGFFMSTKCKRPDHMKFGMGERPSSVMVSDSPVQLHAFGLPEGVSINIVKCEDDLVNKPACFGYSAPAIDPCTGAQAALSAENPTAVLNAEGTYKMEVVGAEVEDIWETAAVFCYELSGDVSLLLKKADGGLSPADVKAIVETCITPLIARIEALEECIEEIKNPATVPAEEIDPNA